MRKKNSIKKIAALGFGALLVATSAFGSVSADLKGFPDMFIDEGKFNGIIVVGEDSRSIDTIGMADISTALQSKTITKETVCEDDTTVVEEVLVDGEEDIDLSFMGRSGLLSFNNKDGVEIDLPFSRSGRNIYLGHGSDIDERIYFSSPANAFTNKCYYESDIGECVGAEWLVSDSGNAHIMKLTEIDYDPEDEVYTLDIFDKTYDVLEDGNEIPSSGSFLVSGFGVIEANINDEENFIELRTEDGGHVTPLDTEYGFHLRSFYPRYRNYGSIGDLDIAVEFSDSVEEFVIKSSVGEEKAELEDGVLTLTVDENRGSYSGRLVVEIINNNVGNICREFSGSFDASEGIDVYTEMEMYYNMEWVDFTGHRSGEIPDQISNTIEIDGGRITLEIDDGLSSNFEGPVTSEIDGYSEKYISSKGTILHYDQQDRQKMKIQYPAKDIYKNVEKVVEGECYINEVVNEIPSTANKLDSEVSGVSEGSIPKNMITIGGPCANQVTAALMGNPEDCAEGFEEGMALLKLVEDNNNVALIVAGGVGEDTRIASTVLKEYESYEDKLVGKEIELTTVNEADIGFENIR